MSQVIADRYEMKEVIGQGGMGEVYRGYDSTTETPVAVKVLKQEVVEADPDLLERFIREGQALRKLDHPNIVKVLDTLQEQGRNYIVMEFVGGGSLRDVIKRESPLPLERVLAIALELADALARAHHLRVIHRDIKPGNVLLAEDGTPRLTDFGVAHMEDMPQMTHTGSLVGTFAYLSPEACRADTLDERTDIWSFGVLLYEMLTGQNPFDTGQPASTIQAILNSEPPDLKELRPDVPPALADLIMRMLRKEKKERVASVRTVGAELESILRNLDTPVRAAINSIRETPESRFDTPISNQPEIEIPVHVNPVPRKPKPRFDGELNTGDWADFGDIRKSKRKAKDTFFDHVTYEDDPASHVYDPETGHTFDFDPDKLKSTVNVGPVKVREYKDGSSHVKVGPLRVLTDSKGNTVVRGPFINVSDIKGRKEHVEVKIMGMLIGCLLLTVICGGIFMCMSWLVF